MRELEEWIRSNIGHAREQRNEWPIQKDYYDGMLFAYGQMLNSIHQGLIQKEKEVIREAFGLYPAGGFIDNEEERVGFEEYYNETFNNKSDE